MIDNKYGRIFVDGCEKDEPCFVLRAQDCFAVPVLKLYLLMIEHLPGFNAASVQQSIEKFEAWPVKKIPDTKEGQYKL